MQVNKHGSHVNWQSLLAYNVTYLAAYVPVPDGKWFSVFEMPLEGSSL